MSQKFPEISQNFQKFLWGGPVEEILWVFVGFSENLKKFLDILGNFKKCHKIPRKLASRSSILNSLNLAVEKGYFIKESVDFDKRIKNYKLSNNFQKVIIDWIEELKAATSNL